MDEVDGWQLTIVKRHMGRSIFVCLILPNPKPNQSNFSLSNSLFKWILNLKKDI